MTFDELLSLASSKNPPRPCTDSRLVKAGDIFIALKGTNFDGHDFIEQAIINGAKYVLCQKPLLCDKAKIIVVDDSAHAAALLTQKTHGNPSSKLTNLAVTGTNGKTTVAFLVRSVIQNFGQQCGLVGTILYDTGKQNCHAALTTPDCIKIAELSEQMVNAGSKLMVIEASSHALRQNRLAGIDFKAAAFTNLSAEHLDYHKTKADYLDAKTKLFEQLGPDATAVLNKQSAQAKQIAQQTKANILWYAIDKPADITAHIESMDIAGTVFTLNYAGQTQKVNTPLLGRYNISNHLAAAGLCLAADIDLQTIAKGLSALKSVPGRLEKIHHNGDFNILIDYAHTDDALKNVLSTLKPLCKGQLKVVFGCGGDRDQAKRPRMANIAEKLADNIIVTSDNPRTEQPEYIIGQIMTGFENPTTETITVEPDRKKAVELAITTAEKDDIILIAGKGHETYQIIGPQKFDFNDSEIVQQCLKKRK